MYRAGEVKLWQTLAYVWLGQLDKAAEVWAQVPDRIRKRYQEEAQQIERSLLVNAGNSYTTTTGD